MSKDVREYINSCEICSARKSFNHKYIPPQKPLSTVVNPMDRVAVDFVGPFPLTKNGNRYILVFIDVLLGP
mgnify:CR=1 FL=1